MALSFWVSCLMIPFCSGQNPVLMPVDNIGEYYEVATFNCSYPSYTVGDNFLIYFNATTVYDKNGPILPVTSDDYGIVLNAGLIQMQVKNASVNDSGSYYCNVNLKNSPPGTLKMRKIPEQGDIIIGQTKEQKVKIQISKFFPPGELSINVASSKDQNAKSVTGKLEDPTVNQGDDQLYDITWLSDDQHPPGTYDISVTLSLFTVLDPFITSVTFEPKKEANSAPPMVEDATIVTALLSGYLGWRLC